MTVYEAYNEIEEAAYVCDEIERLVGQSRLSDTAILRSCTAPTLRAARWKRHLSMRQMKYRLVGAHPLL